MTLKQRALHRLYGLRTGYRWLARLDRGLDRLLPTPATDVCIEGYPRSGNTYAVIAFEKAQARPVRISHHLHAEGQVLWALDRGIPTIVLLRHPLDAVASLLLRDPGFDDDLALARYIAFYRALLPRRDRFVVSRFESTVRGMAPAVEQLNQRFGTRFASPADAGVRKEAVFDEIDRLNANQEGGAVNQLARPDAAKDADLGAIKRRLGSHPLLAEATELWRTHDAVAC